MKHHNHKAALIAVTSNNDIFYDDGAKGGLYWSAALHAYHVFKDAGLQVQFVSENGEWGIDEHSIIPSRLVSEEDVKEYNDKEAPIHKDLANIRKASDIDPSHYKIFFAAGGHASLFDFPEARGLQELARTIYNNGGCVAAVCHGPAIFRGLDDIAGDKKLTCFVTSAEKEMGTSAILDKFHLKTNEQLIKEIGAQLVTPPEPWADFSVIDKRIVTGANPASTKSTIKKAIAAVFES
ncbi:uncharacterized protein CYBJADRAFT_168607 [Cyberlindnera jadinii NRRL Y-1542]|uniref:D-lactate dehydratase n=1 Tax=Cyberlindnera jadinii (strain ATCC 18201 / CBS 1600 / BCRC 20928 / JCM 3617 / NBRC 0987 / NRRL Y-1542) TaxID=983966 RepID=A0A1E4RYN4_CYBJN|nr:hypothetical protein CYBJADRAFT_168607 [Cyberlindnera jadinii NRRL Y-1542]ODV72291.1 hypothetical protein CYBJADRAFT_168607 [Cyberlindnera jadinii NRRL Y-1542]